MIGPKFVAYATSITEPYIIEDWIKGKSAPSGDTEIRLRLTYKVSKIVNERFHDRDTLQASLQGKNPEDLNDRSAIVMIRLAEDRLNLNLNWFQQHRLSQLSSKQSQKIRDHLARLATCIASLQAAHPGKRIKAHRSNRDLMIPIINISSFTRALAVLVASSVLPIFVPIQTNQDLPN